MITKTPLSIRITIPKPVLTGLLAAFYVLAYIVSPYWLMTESKVGIAAILFLIIGIGGIWSYYSASKLIIELSIRDALFFLTLLTIIVLINLHALKYDIPWRGDEALHINKVLWIIERVSQKNISLHLLLYITIIMYLYLLIKIPNWGYILGGIITTAIIIFLINDNNIKPELADFFLRYPFINYLFFSAIPILIAPEFPYHEFLYRVIPTLSAAAISLVFINHLKFKGLKSLALSIGIITIPIIYYYSSILYLELTAAFLMLMVILNAKDLLYADFYKIRSIPAWYALILIGFIKETTVSFLFCFILCRWAIFLKRTISNYHQSLRSFPRNFKDGLKEEIAIIFSITAPLIVYLILRSTLADVRSLDPHLSDLLNGFVYSTLLRAYLEQFGLFFPLFIFGCWILITRKEYPTAMFVLLTFIVTSLIHVVDNVNYTGYSRFNLFILPSVLAGTIVTIDVLTYKFKSLLSISFAAVIVSNLYLSPVYADGSKQVFWGNYLADTSEHYYPYQTALTWLNKEYHDEQILLVSGYHFYYFEFYFDQLNWRPNCEIMYEDYFLDGIEENNLSETLELANKGLFNIVLYQVLREETVLVQDTSRYHLEKVFTNDAGQRLAIYVQKSPFDHLRD